MSLDFIRDEIDSHVKTINGCIDLLSTKINDVAEVIINALHNGKKILICGNGGSAGDSQHFAAELTGRYKRERRALRAIALHTDTSALTAIANDYGYEYVFSRQVEALADADDIVFGISTSGNSKNVVNALEMANKMDCLTISLVGRDGGQMSSLCDHSIIIPSNDTARIQEAHILCIHILCDLVEQGFTGDSK